MKDKKAATYRSTGSRQEIRSYGLFSDAKIIVDIIFSSKTRSDFQKFQKFSKNLEKFAMVLVFFGEFS
jgi:hypothetical protein